MNRITEVKILSFHLLAKNYILVDLIPKCLVNPTPAGSSMVLRRFSGSGQLGPDSLTNAPRIYPTLKNACSSNRRKSGSPDTLQLLDPLYFSKGPHRSAGAGPCEPRAASCLLSVADQLVRDRDQGLQPQGPKQHRQADRLVQLFESQP